MNEGEASSSWDGTFLGVTWLATAKGMAFDRLDSMFWGWRKRQCVRPLASADLVSLVLKAAKKKLGFQFFKPIKCA